MKKLILSIVAILWSTFTIADSILIEGFEYANHDNESPIGWTCNDQTWLCGYQEKDHNRIPHSGNWYAYTNAEESWMFMPLYFSSELRYRFSCWAIADGAYDLEFWGGNSSDPSQMMQCFTSLSITKSEYEKLAVYVESISNNYEFLGIRATAHEGAYHLTIDDINVDVVSKYEFIATPYNADTVLYAGSQARHHFNVQNLGYIPIEVIFSPSHEYFNNFHFYVEGTPCTSFHLEPDEEKEVVVEATLLPSVQPGSTCWLDIMLLLDCDCATSMTTLWVTVLDPTEVAEHGIGEDVHHVELFDLTGKRVDASRLKPGIYIERTLSSEGITIRKILK